MPRLVFLEADFGGFFNTAAHSQEGGIRQLDLKEENEILEHIEVFEHEKFGITAREKAKIKHPTQSGLPEVVRVLIFVLGQANLRHHHVQTRQKVYWPENVRLVGVELRQLHGDPDILPSQFWGDSRSGPS